MTLFTVGFTQKSACQFFSLLKNSNVKRIIDIRANNGSQLSGFAKKQDLPFFLKEILSIDYLEIKDLAPDQKLLRQYRKGTLDWVKYEQYYLEKLIRTNAERSISLELLKNGCLLCSEHEPHFCHRRLAAEYLNQKFDYTIEIKHLY